MSDAYNSQDVKDLVSKIRHYENEMALLKEDLKLIISEYKTKLDLKTFKAALKIAKIKENVESADDLDSMIDVIEKSHV